MHQILMSRKMTLEPCTLTLYIVKKLANVHSDNLMFSKLDDLGCGIRRTDLAWCLMLLCHAHLVSRKGLDYVVKEMEEREFHRLLKDRRRNLRVRAFRAVQVFKLTDQCKPSNVLILTSKDTKT
ncbi:unnamed protein product [Brassica rapa subsp. narinosa]|uniref:(rape) hypothetical protein n=1 Tax=Brassica napus TaxID=3708 RepID=A0A816WRW7_BRANA|nr:unnamed protein product [Brassica napus]